MFKFVSCSIFVISIAFLNSCGNPAEQVERGIKIERIPVVLTKSDLFQGNKVLAFLDNDTKFIQEANELFLKGLNSFRNDNNLDSADYYLVESILKEPSAKAYFELGNVYMDMKKYDKAIAAYGVAEQLDYEPFSKILYNKSCIYSLQDKPEMAGQYLEYALQAGYINIDHIQKDKDLEKLRESSYFKPAVDKGLRGMSDGDNLFWLQFKKLFARTDIPLKLAPEMSPEMLEGLNYISYDYEKYISEMRDEKFSREVSKGFFYYAKPYENENFVAVVYIVKEEFMGEYAPLTYMLATYTHEGKLIDKQEIGGRASLSEAIRFTTLNKNMTINCELRKPKYEKDPDEYGYYENKMISSELIGKQKFKISAKGKIIVGEEIV
jgi:tetratricopeptide (TPR) repeat protein